MHGCGSAAQTSPSRLSLSNPTLQLCSAPCPGDREISHAVSTIRVCDDFSPLKLLCHACLMPALQHIPNTKSATPCACQLCNQHRPKLGVPLPPHAISHTALHRPDFEPGALPSAHAPTLAAETVVGHVCLAHGYSHSPNNPDQQHAAVPANCQAASSHIVKRYTCQISCFETHPFQMLLHLDSYGWPQSVKHPRNISHLCTTTNPPRETTCHHGQRPTPATAQRQ